MQSSTPSITSTNETAPDIFKKIIFEAGQCILGKQEQLQLALCCILARGHLLIEDIPGIGKTTLAKVLARLLGLDFQRIQCTSDMLPGDILGFSVFEQKTGSFTFHPGPIFTQILLSDEINRTPPKTQSALLEAMEEHQVSLEGKTRQLPNPFFVIATQNPLEQAGTYPLPESQLDRFLFRIELGYPNREAENMLLTTGEKHMLTESVSPVLGPAMVIRMQQDAEQVHLDQSLIHYIQDIIDYTRYSGTFSLGLSPRAGLSLLRAAKSWALLNSRDHVLPEDIQYILPYVAGHRLRRAETFENLTRDELSSLFQEIPVPV